MPEPHTGPSAADLAELRIQLSRARRSPLPPPPVAPYNTGGVITPPVTSEWRVLVNQAQQAVDQWREHLRTREDHPMPVGEDGLGVVERRLLAALDALLPVLRRDTPENTSGGNEPGEGAQS